MRKWGSCVMAGKSRNDRRGAALVEMAVFLPVFFMITMATIETCRVIYVRQSLTIAAYECARIGIVPGMTQDAISTQCDLILSGRNVKQGTLQLTPTNLASLQFGDILTVTVSAPADSNSLVGSWFYQGKTLTESVRIMAEF